MCRGVARGALLSLAALAGCAHLVMAPPVAAIKTIGNARAAGLPPMALGEFRPAPGLPPSVDQRISIRTNTFFSPYGSSFASYLKESLATDLRAAGLLDPASGIVIRGELTDSRIDVPNGPATATVAARFVVTRSGVAVYDKVLRVNATWNAPFIGIEAVAPALNRYQQLYRELNAALLGDPAFQAAVKR